MDVLLLDGPQPLHRGHGIGVLFRQRSEERAGKHLGGKLFVFLAKGTKVTYHGLWVSDVKIDFKFHMKKGRFQRYRQTYESE